MSGGVGRGLQAAAGDAGPGDLGEEGPRAVVLRALHSERARFSLPPPPLLLLPPLFLCRDGEEAEEEVPEGLDEKVVQVYRGVGKLLSRYTVGKVPKAFKIIPNLKNWEDVLYLTDPDMWSPQAMFEVRGGGEKGGTSGTQQDGERKGELWRVDPFPGLALSARRPSCLFPT